MKEKYLKDYNNMSVVQRILELKLQNKLDSNERSEFKKNGRPKPQLVLIQTTVAAKRSINRYYRDALYDLADWICGCEIKNAFFCFPCILFTEYDSGWCKVGVTDIKHLKDKVYKHAQSACHIKSAMSFAMLNVDIKLHLDSSYQNSVKEFNEGVSRNRYILKKIIDCVQFCGAFELALHDQDETEEVESIGIFRGLINFVSQLDCIFKDRIDKQDNAGFKGLLHTIQNDLLDSMLAVIHDRIKSEIEKADFVAIQVDEIPSSNGNQLVFIFRYVLNGSVHERFWKCINQPLGSTTEELANAVLKELDILKVNEKPEKLIAQSYDGASIRSSHLAGIQAKIRQTYTSAHFIHCYAHQPDLIVQKAANQYKRLKIFFATLHSFAIFFGKSRKRSAMLDEIVKVTFPGASPSRWNFNTKCVVMVYIYKNEILTCLEKIINTEEDPSSINQAIGLKNSLENKDFLYYLGHFHLIIPHCETLFNQLQDHHIEYVNYVKLKIAEFEIQIVKIKNNIFDSVDLTPLSATTKRFRIQNITRQIVLEMCDIILAEVKDRFNFTNHLIVSRLLHADKFENYTTSFPQAIFKLVKISYPIINDTKLKTELEVLYARTDLYGGGGAIVMLQFLINNNLCETFSETVKLLTILCTLPMTTGESDRCFSTLKRIKTFFKNTVGHEKLCAFTMLSMEKSLIENIDGFSDLVIDTFVSAKDRGIDLIYTK